jgi:hypothetical protein
MGEHQSLLKVFWHSNQKTPCEPLLFCCKIYGVATTILQEIMELAKGTMKNQLIHKSGINF